MKVLFTVGIMWIICYILTLTDAVEPGDPIRTDLKDQLIHDAAWIRFPYPCKITTYTVRSEFLRYHKHQEVQF